MGKGKDVKEKKTARAARGKLYVHVKLSADTLKKVDDMATSLDLPRCAVLEQLVILGLGGR